MPALLHEHGAVLELLSLELEGDFYTLGLGRRALD